MNKSLVGRLVRLLGKMGPYLVVAVLVPGGIVLAILLWISQHKRAGVSNASAPAIGVGGRRGGSDPGGSPRRTLAAPLPWCEHGGHSR